MVKFPKLKKKISSFLTKEEGKISKESLTRVGIFLGSVAIASSLVSAAGNPGPHNSHSNGLGTTYSDPIVTGTHSHAITHTSHGSHGSHNSW